MLIHNKRNRSKLKLAVWLYESGIVYSRNHEGFSENKIWFTSEERVVGPEEGGTGEGLLADWLQPYEPTDYAGIQ